VNRHVLIVEDSRTNAKILTEVLRDEASLSIATTGQEALNRTRSDNPDLVLLDVGLPDMNGFDVCKWIKADDEVADVPVIFITGMEESEDEERGLQVGAIDYIRKPFKPAVVRSRIRNHLALRQANRKLTEANAELARMVCRDPLTGIMNRRSFFAAAENELSRLQRHDRDLSVMMLDIDGLKAINDTYGQDSGDEALVRAAKEIEYLLRQEDVLARLDGGQFAILMPETGLDHADCAAQRLCEHLSEVQIGTPTGNARLTASIGVTGASKCDESVDVVLKRAELALAHVKRAGRNAVKSLSCTADAILRVGAL